MLKKKITKKKRKKKEKKPRPRPQPRPRPRVLLTPWNFIQEKKKKVKKRTALRSPSVGVKNGELIAPI